MVPTDFGTEDQPLPLGIFGILALAAILNFFAVNPVTFFTPTILLLHRYLVTLWQSVLHTPCSPSRLDLLPAPRSPSLSKRNHANQIYAANRKPREGLLNDLVLTVQ